MTACKKDKPLTKDDLYPETPLATASSSAIQAFYKADPFYELYIYRFDPETNKWTNRIRSHFPTVPTSDPTALGFTNPYVTDSGIALFDMVKIYTPQIGTNNIKTAKINADKVFKFFPDFEGAKTGIVKVVDQDIVITKSTTSTFEPGNPTFKIGISGSGTYDERTKIFNIEVVFNETAIGGPSAVSRKYIMSVDAQTLN
jgi:hypothetical protein